MTKCPSITLDTNIINKLSPAGKSPVAEEDVKKLLKHHKKGDCRLCLTTRIHADVLEDPLKADIAGICQKFGITQIASVGRLDFSRLDEDTYASNQDLKLIGQIRAAVFPNTSPKGKKEKQRLSDIDHLFAHWKARNDFFVTADNAILNAKIPLIKKGIQVKSLDEILSLLDN